MSVNEMKKEVRRINKEKNLGLKSAEIDAMKTEEVKDFLAKHAEKATESEGGNEMKDLFEMAKNQLKEEGKEVKTVKVEEAPKKVEKVEKVEKPKKVKQLNRILRDVNGIEIDIVKEGEEYMLLKDGKEFHHFKLDDLVGLNSEKFDMKAAKSGDHYTVTVQGNVLTLTYINRNESALKKTRGSTYSGILDEPIKGKRFRCITTNDTFTSLNSKFTHVALKKCLKEITKTDEDISPLFAAYVTGYMLNGKCGKVYIEKVRKFIIKYFGKVDVKIFEWVK